jgi:hypothetical protein
MFNKLIGVTLIISAFIIEGMWLSFTFGTVVVGILLLIFAPAILLAPFNILFAMGMAFVVQADVQNNHYRSYQHTYEEETNDSYDSEPTFSRLGQYYEILGCNEEDDFETIKKAYKKLSKKFHPDAVQSKGLDAEFVSFATKRMQEINEAYVYIKKTRNI